MTTPASVEELERVKRYIDMRDAKPLRQIDDSIHGIHMGTEWEAELTLADLRAVVSRALSDSRALVECREEAERLAKLVYVPGLTKCAKCGLNLISSTLNADDGSVRANTNPQTCPNGCGPMWKVSERDASNEVCDRLDAANAALAEATEVIREGLAGLDRASAQCPVRQQLGLGSAPCPKCCATTNHNCGPEIEAYAAFETRARTFLKENGNG